MLAEIDETAATGETARIFAEVRRLWGVPYVSAIHRHMATRPGVLEWAWSAVGPAFGSGAAQEAAWRAADGIALAPLDPVGRDALAVFGVDGAARDAVRATAAGFVRVAPVNMVFAGLVKALLAGDAPGGGGGGGGAVGGGGGRADGDPAATWLPPDPLPAPPAMLSPDALAPELRAVLMRFASTTGGRPFVPGLWRMLAHWPGLLAHLAVVLVPRLTAPATLAACDELRARIDEAVPDVLATLPPLPPTPATPDAAERAHFLEVGRTYRKTSPELVVLGRLIGDALA